MTKRTVPTHDPKKIKLTPGHAVAGETRRVPVGDIHVLENLNLRVRGTTEYDQAVDEFAASITANGFYDDKPLAGYLDGDGKVIVVDGHRRLEAIQKVNNLSLDGDVITDVPVVLKPEDATLADLTVAMIQSSSGKDLTMFEKGLGVRRLMADGMDKPEISRRLAVSEKTLDNWLLVASVPAKARDMLLDGKVTSTHVLRTKGDVARLSAMIDKATAAGRSRAREGDGELTAGKRRTVKEPALAAPYDPATAMTADEAYATVATSVTSSADDANTFTITIVNDASMGAVLKQLAGEIRKVVPHSQDEDDFAKVNGTITVSVTLDKPKRRRKAVEVVDASEAQVAEPEAVPAELAHAIPADEL